MHAHWEKFKCKKKIFSYYLDLKYEDSITNKWKVGFKSNVVQVVIEVKLQDGQKKCYWPKDTIGR